MDQDAAWGPCEFQLANWAVQEAPAEAWSPAAAAGLPVEYGTCSLPAAYVPQPCWGGQHLVESYHHYSATINQPNLPAPEVTGEQNRQVITAITTQQVVVEQRNDEETNNKVSNDGRVSGVFEHVESKIGAAIDMMKKKMHRYPASLLQALEEGYTVPRYVAIGPYHHHRAHLRNAETVKHAAAVRCVRESGRLLEDLYSAVASAADEARCLYDKDMMAGIGDDDFRHMMFFDACFLVQYMLMRSRRGEIDPSLGSFLSPNRIDILHDVMLLENQIPWKLVETVMRFRPVPYLPYFIFGLKGFLLQVRDHEDYSADSKATTYVWYADYEPPHLLGLLRYQIVGKTTVITDDTSRDKDNNVSNTTGTERRWGSASAMELAEIGVTLKAKETTALIHMGLEEGTILAELSLAPLCLDHNRASHLVNMAALELSTVDRFAPSPEEDSAVCSYLLLLAMLVYKEEDVHELRARGILEGGRGLTNQEALRFFTSLQGLRPGPCYTRVMKQIARYREKRRVPIKLYAYYHKKKKVIYMALSAIIAVIGIFGTLVAISVQLRSRKA